MRDHILILGSVLLVLAGCNNKPEGNGFSNVPDPSTQPCTVAGSSNLLIEQGILAGATHYECAPRATVGGGPRVIDHDGVTTLVGGGSTELELMYEQWETPSEPRMMIIEIDDEFGFYVIDQVASPEEIEESGLLEEFFVSPNAPGGDFEVRVAFDDGTGTPDNPRPVQWYRINFDIVPTIGGALQFALNWDTPTDVDLHVIDPDGDIVFYANPQSASGGQLDLDSNAGCNIDGVQNENVIWNAQSAPAGDYRVAVNLWSACGLTGSTDWRLTILVDGEPVQALDGTLQATDEDPGADPLDVVTTFTYP